MSWAGNGTERTKSTEIPGQEGDGAATEGNFQNVGPAHKGPWRWDSKSHIKPLEGSNQGEDMSKSAFLKFPSGDSLVVRGLGLHVLTARGPDSIADGGTK